MSSSSLRSFAAAPLLLLGGAAYAVPAISPPPRIGEWLAGTGSATPLTVERAGALRSPETKALLRRYAKSLAGGKLPAEGYLVEVGERGAVAVTADAAGETRLRQTLRQLPAGPGACPRLRIADWPVMRWRGLHVLDSGAASLPKVKRLVHEVLGPRKCNVLVYEIDYNFAFASHPELAGGDAWTRTAVGELLAACAEEGIRVIPEINCLGHQSWKEPPGELLRAHPELEEIPDGRVPQSALGTPDFYCRSWCPRNPETNKIVFALVDELLDAFHADAFHCGMDEVFIIASDKCPRCKGANPAEVFAKQVNDLHAHLAARHAQMLMWADRLVDGKATGYGDWDASTNGTAPAIDRVPTDIVECDWHYDDRESYPSLKILSDKGFRVWPTIYSDAKGARNFMGAALARKDPRMLGVLASIWYPAGQMADGFLDGHPDRIALTAAGALEHAWTGFPAEDPVFAPAKATFLDAVDVTLSTSAAGAVIRYTLDGTPPAPSSSRYAGPIRLDRSAVVSASFATADGMTMRGSARAYERLVPREPDGRGKGEPGLAYACYLADAEGWEVLPDFAKLKPDATGTVADLDPAKASRTERYAMEFRGFLEAPAAGLYAFRLKSDDGSRLYVGDRLVVDNDGLHQAVEKSGEIALKPGRHAVRVQFLQGEGDRILEASWEGPGMARQRIPASAWSR